MADEITVTAHIRCVNGNLSVSTPTGAKQFDQTTARAATFTVDAATTETTVDFGDVSPGMILLENLDSTNYCEYTTVTGNYDLKLLAGGGKALIQFSGAQTLYLKANTATCKIQVTGINS